MVLLRPKTKSIFNLKIKLNGKQLYETSSMKYLATKIVNNLNWKVHLDKTGFKLIRANPMLYKVRDYVSVGILKAI